MRDRIASLATGAMVVAALATTVVVVRHEFAGGSQLEAAAAGRPEQVAKWRVFAEGGTRTGPIDAPIVITEFADFQCPYCRRFATSVRELRQRHPGKIALSFRHYPLDDIHPYARVAGYAAECAARVGRFQQVHDVLLEKQDSIGILSWSEVGYRAGVSDLPRFEQCMGEPAVADRINADYVLGDEAGVDGTPTVFVNEWRLTGTPSVATLDSLVRAILRRAER
jgi:protein-disulfide isomerase